MRDRQLVSDPIEQAGFTLVEILVVVLIVSILVAVALPTFLGQSVKASDSAAKVQLGTMETAMQAYASEHKSFAGATLAALEEIEPTLKDTTTALAQEVKNVSATGYELESIAKGTGDRYTLEYEKGAIVRGCKDEGGGTGCENGSW